MAQSKKTEALSALHLRRNVPSVALKRRLNVCTEKNDTQGEKKTDWSLEKDTSRDSLASSGGHFPEREMASRRKQ